MTTCKRGHVFNEDTEVWQFNRKRGRMQRQCRICRQAVARAYRAKAEVLQKVRRYGIPAQRYYERLREQRNLCAICGQPEVSALNGRVKELSIDHDHELGVVRGLLCNSCNRALGLLRDDPETVEAAARYLRKWWPVEAFKDAA